ncbi:oligosaccharide repeat unit polymerase [Pedobacter sp. SD-b]|uniref:Oligosaccharide repeat unit polymerase n=1 Tax=Pedobacter segetis TaxID=2793069 RepID=A0ABS1BMH6_9SPHI|nr:O-antigen polymerase [Pedobacter segetis]MBK0384095.1 oligosaccharide repeat unit polymerase [Pedobacter segetis]
MEWYSFGLLLADNIALFLKIFAASLIIYTIIFKRLYISVLDPIVFTLLFSVFGFTVVWFLYFTKQILTFYLISYLLTQIAFFIGLFSFKSLSKTSLLSKTKIIKLKNETLFLNLLFIISSTLYILLCISTYFLVGVPLFMDSHVDIYSNSGGLGFLGRFIDVLKPTSIFLLIILLFDSLKLNLFTLYKFFFLICIIIFSVLSGSKSEFIKIGLIFFCFLILNANKYHSYFNKLRKYEIGLFITAFLIIISVIMVQGNTKDTVSLNDSLFSLYFRMVSSGDTYFFAYPNGAIESINGNKPFLMLFGDFFGALRFIPRESLPEPLGITLFNLYLKADYAAGPNPRHNVLGYVYFGFYGSIVFSFCIGFLLSFFRNKLFFTLRKNISGQLIFVLVYLNLVVLETDTPMALSGIGNILITLPILLAITFPVFLILTTSVKKQHILC